MKRTPPDKKAAEENQDLVAERRNDTITAGVILIIIFALALGFIWYTMMHYSDTSKTGGSSIMATPENAGSSGAPAAASGSSGSSSGSSASSGGNASSGSSSGASVF